MIKDFISNISAGGLFIETGMPLLDNQELTTTFFLADSEGPIKLYNPTAKVPKIDSIKISTIKIQSNIASMILSSMVLSVITTVIINK